LESDWRWGVFKAGMSNSNWKFAATSVVVSPVEYVILVKTFDGSGDGFYLVQPTGLPLFLSPAGPVAGHPNFPWGEFVFPD